MARGFDSLLFTGFLNSVENTPEAAALVVAGETLSYQSLFRRAAGIAAALESVPSMRRHPLTAVLAHRSTTAYAAVLGSLLAGHGYVPLHPKFPIDRTQTMLLRSGSDSLIVDASAEARLPAILHDIDRDLLIVLPDRRDPADLRGRWPRHRFVTADGVTDGGLTRAPNVSPDAPAYLLFTSGTTGAPKGVAVTHRNARHCIDHMVTFLGVGPDDRFSQMFDMTFDPSVADMFVAWSVGASVHCPNAPHMLQPGRFIQDHGITVWNSVPSTAALMRRFGALKPGAFPSVRLSLFGGEALPVDLAAAWMEAAPNTVVENMYGPTEATIACMHHRWQPEHASDDAELGIVPIGAAFPHVRTRVVDDALREVSPGMIGELLVGGPQVTIAYWNDPTRTAASYVVPPGRADVHYRTGDRVRRPLEGRPMTFHGRIDDQVKIMGYRVELPEIEAVLREESGVDAVVAVAWPPTASGAAGVEAFIAASASDEHELKERVGLRLPTYMVPRRIHFVSEIPLNPNGKFDRVALRSRLEEGVE